jgi:hypothetical protein
VGSRRGDGGPRNARRGGDGSLTRIVVDRACCAAAAGATWSYNASASRTTSPRSRSTASSLRGPTEHVVDKAVLHVEYVLSDAAI